MNNLVLFNESQRKKIISKRKSETKFGEHVQLLSNFNHIYDQMLKLDVRYVILGISEDIGVFANNGKSGTSKAWDAVIKVLLNIQNNSYTTPSKVLILGNIYPKKALKKLKSLDVKNKKDIKKARKMVEKIDKEINHLVFKIVKAGKIPVIIGGGHNNAYGNIKGTALALNKPINAVNLDAHTDFSPEEGRHSGNGFSYAFTEGFLKKYFIFGLQENQASVKNLKTLNKLKKKVKYNTFEAMKVRKDQEFASELQKALAHVSDRPFGIEVDCDAIEPIPSSAMTSIGFSSNEAREFVSFFGKEENASYLHICDAAPNLGSDRQAVRSGKLIATLITDFMRAHDN